MSNKLPTPPQEIKVDSYQIAKVGELSKEYPEHNALVMHNNEEGKHISTQVEKLTEGELSYGEFKHGNGVLVNDKHKLVIVMPEKHLEELDLFSKVKEQFSFVSDDINFVMKKSLSDINYLVRENNEKGDIELNGKSFKVFEAKPSGRGDQTNAYIVKNETPKIKVKVSNDKKSSSKMTNRPS